MTSPLPASLATSKSTSLYVCFPNLVVIGLKEAEMSTLINYDMIFGKSRTHCLDPPISQIFKIRKSTGEK